MLVTILTSMLMVSGPSTDAAFVSTKEVREVRGSGTTQTLLRVEVTLSRESRVLIQGDGVLIPKEGSIETTVSVRHHNLSNLKENRGEEIANRSAISWKGSRAPREHGFNVIGCPLLKAGRHGFQLVVEARGHGSLRVSAGSSLSAFVFCSESVREIVLEEETADLTMPSTDERIHTVKHHPVLSTEIEKQTSVVALVSASAYMTGFPGDALIALYRDGKYEYRSIVAGVNDLTKAAELRAPLYAHGWFSPLDRDATLTLGASRFPWNGYHRSNPVRYRIERGARMIVIDGPFEVGGSSGHVPYTKMVDASTKRPKKGWQTLHETVVTVPENHDGQIMFVAKSRVQALEPDRGGRFSLRLMLDGRPVGPLAAQGIAREGILSQRTLTTSYLSARERALQAGSHKLVLQGRLQGEFTAPMTRFYDGVLLMWFDRGTRSIRSD